MIHTGPIHLKAHTEDDCCCEDECEFPETKDFPDLKAALVAGFWWECSHCGRHTGYDDEDDDELPELDPVCTVFNGSNVICHAYCTPACHDKDQEERRQLRVERQFRETAKKLVES